MKQRLVGLILVCGLLGVNDAWAQQKYVGGGLAYNIDVEESAYGLTGAGTMPVNLPTSIPFRPALFSPRFTFFPGLDYWQIDANMLWDIPLQNPGNFGPYIGMGVGLNRFSTEGFSETTPVLNFNMGLRYKKPEWRMHLLADANYSSGLDYPNTMHFIFGVLVPFGN